MMMAIEKCTLPEKSIAKESALINILVVFQFVCEKLYVMTANV